MQKYGFSLISIFPIKDKIVEPYTGKYKSEKTRFLAYFTQFNPLSAKFIKWSNTLKQIVGKLPTICLSVFDHFSGLAPKGLILRRKVLMTVIKERQLFRFYFFCCSTFIVTCCPDVSITKLCCVCYYFYNLLVLS